MRLPWLLAFLCFPCASSMGSESEAPLAAARDAEKIDPEFAERLAKLPPQEEVRALILLSPQLAMPPDGFRLFCERNANAKRRALREETIARLREIASAARAKLREEFPLAEDTRSHWLVNAVSGTFRVRDLRRALERDDVLHVLALGGSRERGAKVGARTEAFEKPLRREPFEIGKRRVPWNLRRIRADRAWNELKATGAGVVVAMFDDGTDHLHEDLVRNVLVNPLELPANGKDDDRNGYVDDVIGFDFGARTGDVSPRGERQHGTWTSGIVAGDGTGGTITGVAPRAQLLIVRGGGSHDIAIEVFEYLLTRGADVCNMSFSRPLGASARMLWRLMAEHATCAGLVLVSGAGNFARQQAVPVQQRIPEGIPCVISVGGIDEEGNVVPFSSRGPVEWGSVPIYRDWKMPEGLLKPDVAAFPGPGYPILETKGGLLGNRGYVDPNTSIRGNSFSGPHVAGTVALMLSANPDLPAWQCLEILKATALDQGVEGPDMETGSGLVNAYAAVLEARDRAGE